MERDKTWTEADIILTDTDRLIFLNKWGMDFEL
jgi:hypothetical protein